MPMQIRSRRKEQASSCFILGLPSHLIVLLSSYLTPASRILFSQTCRSLHDILDNTAPATGQNKSNHGHHTRDEHLEYLALLAKDLPRHWACEACTALHRVSRRDLPTSPECNPCPLGKEAWRERVYDGESRVDRRQIALDHRHVQLALKYTRTQSHRYRGYLRALLKPYHDPKFCQHASLRWERQTTFSSKVVQVDYSIRPKIVAGPDGQLRFLLLSTWRYNHKQQDGAILRYDLGNLAICPHTEFCYDRNRYCILDRVEELESAVNEVRQKTQWDQDPSAEACGACPRCPTDFAVRGIPGCMEVRVWQDMGTEGSPMDLSWRNHVKRLDLQDQNFYCLGPVLEHQPGSVRSLFEANQKSPVQRPRGWNLLGRIRGLRERDARDTRDTALVKSTGYYHDTRRDSNDDKKKQALNIDLMLNLNMMLDSLILL